MARRKFKKKEWRTPNRMRFDSGYRTFDREVDLVSDGNVVSRVQLSTVVRRVSDLNGYPQAIKPGECRRFDLGVFRNQPGGVPRPITDYIDEHPEEPFWLYCWRLPGGPSKRATPVAWVLTDYDAERALVGWCGNSRKAVLVLREACKYVVKGRWQ